MINLAAPRYTPAGIPVQQGRLRHHSQQQEVGVLRQVMLELDVVAIGELSAQLARIAQGQACCVSGFLAQKSMRNSQLVLHVCSVETI